jgi:glycosyltransferase involved in cell wall biosynthesis
LKIFTVPANENWVCDRFTQEWIDNNPSISTENIEECDILWLLAGWRWNHIPERILRSKKVVLTVHHIVPEKFDLNKINEFKFRDQFIDVYHVPCNKTKDQVCQLTDKPIEVIPFWANQNIWNHIPSKDDLRKDLGIDKECFLIGSFQRDTEGSDLKSPKLEKGPDIFCDIVENLFLQNKNIKILLAGWRRHYVINRLEKAKIPYYYFELPDFEELNKLYNCLDLYLVTSRYEGGPQSIVECALSKTPVVSTDVGIAKDILSENSIFRDEKNPVPDTDYAFEKIQKLKIPDGFYKFNKMFTKILEE